MIEVRELFKRFNKKEILNGLNMTVPDGSIYGLVGLNGSGKSTLMRLICGVLKADSGSITIDGTEVYDSPAAKSRLAFVPDEPYFLPGADLHRMAKLYKSLRPSFSDSVLFELAHTLRIDADRKISDFSKGKKRQTAIILALACQPKYLIMDETFDGLDPAVRGKVRKIIFEKIAVNGMTVLMTSHSLRELDDTCDVLSLLHGGKIAFSGDIHNIKSSVLKVQTAFNSDFDEKCLCGLEILSLKKTGRVVEFAARADAEQIKARILPMSPLFFEVLPLTLEEVFIYETGAIDFDGERL